MLTFVFGNQMRKTMKRILTICLVALATALAAAHGKTPAQVIIRWHLQEGRSVIPGSKTPSHIDENFDVFDFALSSADMARIRGINKEDPFFKMGPLPADFGRN